MAITTKDLDTKGLKKGPEKTLERLSISARSRGMYNDLMGGIEDRAKKALPGKVLRWVYAPEDRQDYSQLIKRRAMGYEIVSSDEIGLEDLSGATGKPTTQIRVGDVILMAIDQDRYDEIREAKEEDARLETGKLQKEFYESIDGIARETGREVAAIGEVREGKEVLSVNLPKEKE